MLKSDFAADWKEFMISVLASHGYPIDDKIGIRDVAIKYYNAAHRRISARPRTISKSDVFTCPPEHSCGLAALEKKIKNGEDLTPHLSRGTKDISSNDDLLSDWGIHHLHLGIPFESDGYVTRTGPVVFVFPSDTTMHMIQVYPHGNWSNREVIDIIHRKWPNLISTHKLKGVVDISMNPSSDTIARLRKCQINTAIKLDDGSIYLSPGGGMASDGTPINVVFDAMRSIKKIKHWDSYINSQPSEIISELKHLGYDGATIVHFKLKICPSGVYALAQECSLSVKLEGKPDGKKP